MIRTSSRQVKRKEPDDQTPNIITTERNPLGYRSTLNHVDNPAACTADVVERVAEGTLSPEDAGKAIAALPIEPNRGKVLEEWGLSDRWDGASHARYEAFHPRDVVTDALFDKIITSEDYHITSTPTSPPRASRCPTAEAAGSSDGVEEGWRPATDPPTRGS